MRVAIVGSGVMGLTTAVTLAEQGHEPIIFSRDSFESTTSSVAAAVWFPYDAEPTATVDSWALLSYGRFSELAVPSAKTRLVDADTGVAMIDFEYRSILSVIPVPEWANIIGFRHLCPKEGTEHLSGFQVRVPRIDTSRYLPYLKRRSGMPDEAFRIANFRSLEDVPDGFDVIVNSAGFGARELAKDEGMAAHRGQVVVVEPIDDAPAFVLDEPLTYLVPRERDCVLGGVNEDSDSTFTDSAQTNEIIERCMRIAPLRVQPKVITARAGIRPKRSAGVRLEAQRLPQGRLVIHNYGHGGCGVSLSWGCAQKVAELVDQLRSA